MWLSWMTALWCWRARTTGCMSTATCSFPRRHLRLQARGAVAAAEAVSDGRVWGHICCRALFAQAFSLSLTHTPFSLHFCHHHMTSFLRMPLALLHFSFFSGFVMARTMCIAFFLMRARGASLKRETKPVFSPPPRLFFFSCHGL